MSDQYGWNKAYDENGNEYFYQDTTGTSSWTLPVGAVLNDPYPALKLKEPPRQGFDPLNDSHDYVNGVWGYESNDEEDEKDDNTGANGFDSPVVTKQRMQSIEPPADDAKGSPYRESYINLKALRSPTSLTPSKKQSFSHKHNSRNTPTKQQLLTQHNNAQALAAFGGGSSSINELLESDVDRQLRKIQKMKDEGGTILRTAGRWAEWEAANGAVFYVYNNQHGGQWDKPKVFELDDSNYASNIGSGSAPLGNKRDTKEVVKRQHDIVVLANKAGDFVRTGGGTGGIRSGADLQSYQSYGQSFMPDQTHTPNRQQEQHQQGGGDDNRYESLDLSMAGEDHQEDQQEDMDEYGEPNPAALNSTLKQYYQKHDNATRRGMSTFDDVAVPAVLRKKFESPVKDIRVRGGGGAIGMGTSKINSPIRSLSGPSKTANDNSGRLGLSSSASAVGLAASTNRLNVTRNDSFLDRTAAADPSQAEISSFFHNNDYGNPFNEPGLVSPMKNSHLEETNKIRINAAEDKYKNAYNALKERDAVNIGTLEYEVLSKDAERAQRRWKEFLHNTNQQNYSKLAGTDEFEEQYLKDRYGVDNSREQGGGSEERPPVEDDMDEYLTGTLGVGLGDHAAGDADFNVLYARSIVVQQRWPWTCLVDMKTDKRFYRQEVEDFFQFDPPAEFEETEREDEERELFDILEGVGPENDGTVSRKRSCVLCV